MKITKLLNPDKSNWHVFEVNNLPFSAVGVTQFEGLVKQHVSLDMIHERSCGYFVTYRQLSHSFRDQPAWQEAFKLGADGPFGQLLL